MTYAEILEWLDDNGYFEGSDLDIYDVYENIEANWDGRSDFSDIMSLEEFSEHFENYNNLSGDE